MSDLVERLKKTRVCIRCKCPDCTRGGFGELHDHVCTDGPNCIESREKLRERVKYLRWLCSQAAEALGKGGE
ncbi:hypothetical protein SAMN05428963_10829 [Consotaella salsifontis]|uniref:Uncharacterized protein n=1 Tax=Consotaella salsifontis TaxID=1365950 RepID=A0A1T4RWH5_9HYPH|nr:hypothetical protein SAMN05428963_10829 [Consotaella salsifontis]